MKALARLAKVNAPVTDYTEGALDSLVHVDVDKNARTRS